MSRLTRLDKSTVVKAAADLVNAEGPAGLSLSRLADSLGVQTPSLYNHIKSLGDLQHELALMNAHMLVERLKEAAIGRSGPELIMEIANAYREYIKEFPGLYMSTLRVARYQSSESADLQQEEERGVKIGMAAMASFGLYGEDAVHAVRAVRSLVHGFATLEIAGGFGLPLDCDESFRRLINVLIRGLQPSA